MTTSRTENADDSEPAWRRRKKDRPHEIKAAAKRLLEDHGVAGVSVARIAAAAEVSEALVYRYFENKQALVNEVLTEWATPFIKRLLEELSRVEGARTRLILIATLYLRNMDETPRLHRVFYQELRWVEYEGSRLHRLNKRFTNTVVETIELGIAAGELREGLDAAMVRDMLFGGLEHIAMRTSLAGKPKDPDALGRSYIDVMLKGLLTAPKEAPIERIERLVARLEARMDESSG